MRILLLLALPALAGHAVLPPRLGCILDASGEGRELFGMAANFLLGGAVPCRSFTTSHLQWPDGAALFLRDRTVVFRSPGGEEQIFLMSKDALLRPIDAIWIQAGPHVFRRTAAGVERYILPREELRSAR